MLPASLTGGWKPAPRRSADLERVLGLARRPPLDLKSPRAIAMVELMTARLRRPDRPVGAPCGCAALGRRRCVDRLLPAQAWALYEAPLAGGLLAPIGVGSGKTLLDILMAVAMGAKVAALFVPPGLVGQLWNEYNAIGEHFIVPSIVMPAGREGRIIAGRPVVHVVPYSRFQRAGATDYLEKLAPDLLIADEAHSLKSREAARTARVLRYLASGTGARLCAWSGTITSRSLLDFSHLLAFALGDGAPLPLDPDEVSSWAAAVDPSDWPAEPGALTALCEGGESVREGVGRRLRETRGFVSAPSGDGVDATIRMVERDPGRLPAEIIRLRREVRETWVRPDGEELVEAPAVARVASQLACGFYYRWRFPGSPERELVDEWFAARRAWGREMRAKLLRAEPHLDSKQLLANAAERFETGYKGDLPVWHSDAWPRWRDVRRRVRYETEAVWVDDFLVRDACDWLSSTRGILWYEHRGFGEAVAKAARLPLHSGGPGAEARILAEKGDRSIVASMSSHGEGRDGLQFAFSEQLVVTPPSSGKEWEQLLGRLHRVGQRADEVVTHVCRHVEEYRDSVDRAVTVCKYVEGLLSANQKLLSADVEWGL